MKNSIKICLAALGLVLMGCEPIYIGGKLEESGGGGMEHPFSTDVAVYDGRLASDSLADIVGRDPYIFWEQNQFPYFVKLTWDGPQVQVESNNDRILCETQGAHVVVDMLTRDVAGVVIIMQGKSDDASLKIYGRRNIKLEMNGVQLVSKQGPVINNQCKKRLFVHLNTQTVNTLEDAPLYADDFYYITGNDALSEDRKGCFFSEGHLVFSGRGVLRLKAKQRHGIASDATLYLRPGVTLVVDEAAKNAIHVKGDADDDMGIHIAGGYIYAKAQADAGKCIKTDLHFLQTGGELCLNTTGHAIYESQSLDAAGDEPLDISGENLLDTSSPACIKADANVHIKAGSIFCRSIGSGGKAINCDGNMLIEGGIIQAVTNGDDYFQIDSLSGDTLSTYPHVLKADADLRVMGGQLNLAASLNSEKAAVLKSNACILMAGGELFAYAGDDVLNAVDIHFRGGRSFLYSVNNDVLDADREILLEDGLILANAANPFQSSMTAPLMRLDGAILLALSGSMSQLPAQESLQAFRLQRFDAKRGQHLALMQGDSCLMAYEMPFGLDSLVLLSSHPALRPDMRLFLGSSANITSSTQHWHGFYENPIWIGGRLVK